MFGARTWISLGRNSGRQVIVLRYYFRIALAKENLQCQFLSAMGDTGSQNSQREGIYNSKKRSREASKEANL